MGASQSSIQKCLVVLRVNDTSRCFPHLSPFIHAVTKYNSIPIQSEDDIKKMAAQPHLDLEILDLRNLTTKHLSVPTPLGIGVKFCIPRLLELKVLEVERKSPAEGKIVEGDFVIGIENFYFETNDDFFHTIYRNRGGVLNFIVYRDCRVRRVPVKLNKHEPFFGAVFGEGILMTADKSGDVVNIGTHAEYQSESAAFCNKASPEGAAAMQTCAEGKLEKGIEGITDDARDTAHEQCRKSSTAEVEEKTPDGEKQSDVKDIHNIQPCKMVESPCEMLYGQGSAAKYNAARKSLLTTTSSGQSMDRASFGVETRNEVAMDEPCVSNCAENTCSSETCKSSFQHAENIESHSISDKQQPGIFVADREPAKSTVKEGGEVTEHTYVNNIISFQDTDCEAGSTNYAHGSMLGDSAVELGKNKSVPLIIGKYSSEDKLKLLETLTGVKSEKMTESS